MNWSLAKNISIVCLMVLNLLLGGLVYFTSTKYTLTAEQEQALAAYLSRSNVSINGETVKNFAPMPPLTLTPHNFTADEKNYTIDGNTVYYRTPGDFSDTAVAIDIASARQTAEAFMAQDKALFESFTLDKVYEQDGTTVLEYRTEYKSTMVYSNFVRFTLDSNGIGSVEMQISDIIGTDGESRDILSPDAALYLFVQNADYIFGDEPITLDSMDIVYLDAEDGTAVPGYRFYLQGSDIPVLMNAYTNEIVSGF